MSERRGGGEVMVEVEEVVRKVGSEGRGASRKDKIVGSDGAWSSDSGADEPDGSKERSDLNELSLLTTVDDA
jgi:hypothetical protein